MLSAVRSALRSRVQSRSAPPQTQAVNTHSQPTFVENSSSMQQVSPEGGYPCSMFLMPPPDDLKCSICMEVLRDAVQVCKQQHVYCRGCIGHWKKTNSRCPECRAPFTEEQPARLATNMILQLEVRCPEFNEWTEACEWTGRLSDREAHVAVCPTVEVCCPFAEAGCDFRAARRDMGAHNDIAAHLLMMMSTIAAVKAENAAKYAAVEAECAAVKAENHATQRRIAAVEAECAALEAGTAALEAGTAALEAECESAKEERSSLQLYVSILHDEEASLEWVISRTVAASNDYDEYTYTGQMRGGECHGFGRAAWAADSMTYDGQWKEGKKSGVGLFRWEVEGRQMSYEGLWVGGQKQGRFVYRVDGSRYEHFYADNVLTQGN